MRKPSQVPDAKDAHDEDPEDAFIGALERLAARCSEQDREHVRAVGVVLAAVAAHPSAANRRLLSQMAAIRRLPGGNTGAERLTRAALLVEEAAPQLKDERSLRTLQKLARRLAIETAESALLDKASDGAACAFMLETFAKWVPTVPKRGEKSTAGVLAALADHFRPARATGLWDITGRDEEGLRRSIESRLRAGRQSTPEAGAAQKSKKPRAYGKRRASKKMARTP